MFLNLNAKNKKGLPVQFDILDSRNEKELQPKFHQRVNTSYKDNFPLSKFIQKHLSRTLNSSHLRSQYLRVTDEMENRTTYPRENKNSNISRWLGCHDDQIQRSRNANNDFNVANLPVTFTPAEYESNRIFKALMGRRRQRETVEKNPVKVIMDFMEEANSNLNKVASVLRRRREVRRSSEWITYCPCKYCRTKQPKELEQNFKRFQEALKKFEVRVNRPPMVKDVRNDAIQSKKFFQNQETLNETSAVYRGQKTTKTKAEKSKKSQKVGHSSWHLPRWDEDAKQDVTMKNTVSKVICNEDSDERLDGKENNFSGFTDGERKEVLEMWKRNYRDKDGEGNSLQNHEESSLSREQTSGRLIPGSSGSFAISQKLRLSTCEEGLNSSLENSYDRKVQRAISLPERMPTHSVRQYFTRAERFPSMRKKDSLEKLDEEYQGLMKELVDIFKCKDVGKLPKDVLRIIMKGEQENFNLKEENTFLRTTVDILDKDVSGMTETLNRVQVERLLEQEKTELLLLQMEIMRARQKLASYLNKSKAGTLPSRPELEPNKGEEWYQEFGNMEEEIENALTQIQREKQKLQRGHTIGSMEEIPTLPSRELARYHLQSAYTSRSRPEKLPPEARAPSTFNKFDIQKQSGPHPYYGAKQDRTKKSNKRDLTTSNLKNKTNELFPMRGPVIWTRSASVLVKSACPDYDDDDDDDDFEFPKKSLEDNHEEHILTREHEGSEESLDDFKTLATPAYDDESAEHAIFHRFTFQDDDEDHAHQADQFIYQHMSLSHIANRESDNIFTDRHTCSADAILMRGCFLKGTQFDIEHEASSVDSPLGAAANKFPFSNIGSEGIRATESEEELRLKLGRQYSIKRLKQLLQKHSPGLHYMCQKKQ